MNLIRKLCQRILYGTWKNKYQSQELEVHPTHKNRKPCCFSCFCYVQNLTHVVSSFLIWSRIFLVSSLYCLMSCSSCTHEHTNKQIVMLCCGVLWLVPWRSAHSLPSSDAPHRAAQQTNKQTISTSTMIMNNRIHLTTPRSHPFPDFLIVTNTKGVEKRTGKLTTPAELSQQW